MSTKPSEASVRVGLVGLGSIGRHAARLLLDHRHSASVVAAVTQEPDAIGRPLHDVVGAETRSTVIVGQSIQEIVGACPDVVVFATGSFLPDVIDDVVALAVAGINVVSPCEELAFPFTRDPSRAAAIDDAARSASVTVLGTGVNPGFIFDALLTLCSSVAWDIEAIRGRRVVDVSGFGRNIHRRLGIGYTPSEFSAGHADGTIAGHVGFPESIQMVCERIGLRLSKDVVEEFEPLIAESAAPTAYGEIASGQTEGFIQRATGEIGGNELIRLELVLHVRPRQAGFEPADSLEIDGIHPVRLTLSPGMDAILATSAVLVNSIPSVMRSAPGLKSVKDLPLAASWLHGSPSDTIR